MKSKCFKISIFVLLLSILSCGFLLMPQQRKNVYAAETTAQDCYSLLSADGEVYQSTSVVGSVEGMGKFVLGANAAVLTAIAKENYQLVGWQVTYKEQKITGQDGAGNNIIAEVDETDDLSEITLRVEYFDLNASVNLTDLNGKEISATLTNTQSNGYVSQGNFELATVFENLVITPVFDHVYYKVDATALVNIANLTQDDNNSNLYYQNSVSYLLEGDYPATKYIGAIIKEGSTYFYYGDLYQEGENLFTLHKMQDGSEEVEKIDYSRGAFRINDGVTIDYDVKINSDHTKTSAEQIKASTNIDLEKVSLIANETNDLSFDLTQDNFERTTEFTINFNIQQENSYINRVVLDYHRLYFIDIKLTVDGSEIDNAVRTEILGAVTNENNEYKGNVVVSNYYSYVDVVSSLQFFAKKANDNSLKSLIVSANKYITKVIDNVPYTYYVLNTFNNSTNSQTQTYTNLDANKEITIDYSSSKYDVQFGCFEYNEYQDGTETKYSWADMPNGNTLKTISLKRGESILLDENDGEIAFNAGYEFVGYTSEKFGEVSENFTYAIEAEKPEGTTIYLCFKKISYEVKIQGFNSQEVNEKYAINSMSFNFVGVKSTTETYINSDTTQTSTILTNKIKRSESFKLSTSVNSGFKVLYSLKNNASQGEDYITSFELNDEMIKNYLLTNDNVYSYDPNTWATVWDNLYVNGEENKSEQFDESATYCYLSNQNQIVVYVYETILTYSLTYIIDPSNEDTSIDDENVIMAAISVGGVSADKIQMFAIDAVDEDGVVTYKSWETGLKVAKIVVQNLNYGDEVTLMSEGYTVNKTAENGDDESYTYAFNYFIEEGKSTLEKTLNENVYSTSVEITKNKTIKVRYSMPKTLIMFSLDSEIPQDFTYTIVVAKLNDEGVMTALNADKDGCYTVNVNDVLNVSISNIPFGYSFNGYLFDGDANTTKVGTEFEYVAKEGNNILKLQFELIKYNFMFSGDEVDNQSIVLTVTNREGTINKPEGFYVKSVKFFKGEQTSDEYSTLCESNELRNNTDISKFIFKLTEEQLRDISSVYGTEKEEDDKIIVDVNVQITYELFKYNITVNYDITNGERENIVSFPSIRIEYSFESKNIQDARPYQNINVSFKNIPYGAEGACIRVTSAVQIGLQFAGWYLESGEGKDDVFISSNEYLNASDYIELGFINKDLSFSYKLAYTAYYVNLIYNSSEGNPEIEVDGVVQKNQEGNPLTKGVQITIGETIKIYTYPSKIKGYEFGYIQYKASTSEIITFDADSTFEIDEINITQYLIENNTINFTIYYKEIELTLTNQVSKIDSDWFGTQKGLLQHTYKGKVDIEFDIKEMIICQASKTEGIVFKDTVSIQVQINKEAVNKIDNKVYNLSLGVHLDAVSINNKYITINNLGNGLYLVEFYVEDYAKGLTDNNLKVAYELSISHKEVLVTTVVTNSTAFYSNIYMHINASASNFANESLVFDDKNNKDERVILSQQIQFMGKVNFFAQLTNDYIDEFYISGVTIYFDGVEISIDKFLEYSKGDNSCDEEDWNVVARVLNNIKIVYQVQPIITYNGAEIGNDGSYNYKLEFKCDNDGNAIGQSLTIGNSDSNHIEVPEILAECVSIKYQSLTLVNSPVTSYATNFDSYKVFISFDNNNNFDWLDEIVIDDSLTLTITKKPIILTYDAERVGKNKIQQTYNGSSDFDVKEIFEYLIFTDNKGWSMVYADLLKVSGDNLKLVQGSAGIDSYISLNGKDEQVAVASDTYYNIYVYNIALKDNDFNNNFVLNTKDLIVNSYIQIIKKELKVSGVSVFNKVYDGTTNAEIISMEDIKISGKIGNDDVLINPEKLNLEFENAEIGTNKKVVVGLSTALAGKDMNNYYISDINVEGVTIYPYSLTVEVENVGKVSLTNIRGLTEKDKVDLISFNAMLVVEPIYEDSHKYASIYNTIAKHVKGNNEFAVGYTISLVENGVKIPIDKNLYLSVPNVKNLTGVYFLTGSQTGSVGYNSKDGQLMIDLNQVNVDVDSFFLTQKKILLKAWQIVLIVVMSVLVVTAVVLTIVILRKRKHREYSSHDKI